MDHKLRANRAYFQRRARRFQYIWHETKCAYNVLVNQYNILLCQLSQSFQLGKAAGIHETSSFIDNFQDMDSMRHEKIIKLCNEKQKLIEEVQSLKSNTNTSSENSRLLDENENLAKENLKLVEQNQKLVDHNQKLTEEIHKCTEDNKKLGEEIQKLTMKNENQELQGKYEDLDKMNITLNGIICDKNIEITELKEKLEILLDDNKEIFAAMGLEYEDPFIPVEVPVLKPPKQLKKKKKK
jgi:hypothetical protein